MHQPVLLKEVLEFLNPQSGEWMVDGTINGGGHAREILKRISPGGTLLGIDWDKELINDLKKKLRIENAHLFLTHGNHADLPQFLKEHKVGEVDGILLDLGFSSFHIDSSGRGFAFSQKEKDEPLLMTYDADSDPLYTVLPRLTERELKEIISKFSGEKYAGKIARAIRERIKSRRRILTTRDLVETIVGVVPRNYEQGRIHPATRTFQAFRIYINHELENLETLLGHLPEILNPGGRVVIISFHSLEDELVKKRFRELKGARAGEILTPKPIEASLEERIKNPRSRSAKLRVFIKNK